MPQRLLQALDPYLTPGRVFVGWLLLSAAGLLLLRMAKIFAVNRKDEPVCAVCGSPISRVPGFICLGCGSDLTKAGVINPGQAPFDSRTPPVRAMDRPHAAGRLGGGRDGRGDGTGTRRRSVGRAAGGFYRMHGGVGRRRGVDRPPPPAGPGRLEAGGQARGAGSGRAERSTRGATRGGARHVCTIGARPPGTVARLHVEWFAGGTRKGKIGLVLRTGSAKPRAALPPRVPIPCWGRKRNAPDLGSGACPLFGVL